MEKGEEWRNEMSGERRRVKKGEEWRKEKSGEERDWRWREREMDG